MIAAVTEDAAEDLNAGDGEDEANEDKDRNHVHHVPHALEQRLDADLRARGWACSVRKLVPSTLNPKA